MLNNHAVRKTLFCSDAFPFEDTAGSALHPQWSHHNLTFAILFLPRLTVRY